MLAAWELSEPLCQLAEAGCFDIVNDILDTFRTDTTRRLILLRKGLENGDRARLKAEAHAIKGSSLQVGADSLASVCLTLELESPAAAFADLSVLVSQAESEFEGLHSSRSVSD